MFNLQRYVFKDNNKNILLFMERIGGYALQTLRDRDDTFLT